MKQIKDHIGFTFVSSVIGPEYSHHPLNQSDLKPKPVAPASHAFSRALSGLLTFTYNSHFLVVFLVLRHSVEMRSKVTEFAVLSRLCLKCMSTLVTSL